MRTKVLIVDDSKLNRQMLRDELEKEYEVVEAENGKEGLDFITNRHDELLAVLLDIVMPEMDGIELLKCLHEKDGMDNFPVIVITGEQPVGVVEECFNYGISDFIKKPFDAHMVLKRTKKMVDLYLQKNEFKRQVEKQTATVRMQYSLLQKQADRMSKSNESIIEMMGTIVEYRNVENRAHISRVKGLTRIMATKLMEMYPEYELSEEMVDIISNTSALHDFGKIFIPDAILLKPGKLTPKEYEYMKSHTYRGAEALLNIKDLWDRQWSRVGYDIARCHHERYDGGGYPEGLKGEEIPISAQIVSIVDVYDALITEKDYKKAYSYDLAFQTIIRGDCGVFSPKILECFRAARRDMEACAKKFEDAKES